MTDWSWALADVWLAPVWYLVAAVLMTLAFIWALRRSLLETKSALMRFALFATACAFWVLEMALIFPPKRAADSGDHVVISPCPENEALAGLDARNVVWLLPRSELCASVSSWLQDLNDVVSLRRAASVQDVIASGVSGTVRLIGDGVEPSSWPDVPYDWRWQPPTTPPFAGLLNLPDQVALGEPIKVDLSLPASNVSPVVIETSVDGSVVESIEISTPNYRVNLDGLNAGSHRIGIKLRQTDARFVVEAGLHVSTPTLPRVLLINDAPSFEWRALTQWLTDSGTTLVVRSRVSDERFRWFVANRNAYESPPQLSTVVGSFDLVILDGASLSHMDQDALGTLLDTGGDRPGVLIALHDRADVDAVGNRFPSLISKVSSLPRIFRFAEDYWTPSDGYSSLDVVGEFGAVQLTDEIGGLLVAKVPGYPRVHVSLLRDSYRMPAAGYRRDYAALWSHIIADVTPPADAPDITFHPRFVEVGQRLRICTDTSKTDALSAELAGQVVSIEWQPSGWRRKERCAWIWPQSADWLAIKNADGAVVDSTLIAPRGHWLAHDRVRNRLAGERRRANRASAPATAVEAVLVPIDRRRLLVALLMAGLLHWLLQRLVTARREPTRD